MTSNLNNEKRQDSRFFVEAATRMGDRPRDGLELKGVSLVERSSS